MKKLAIMLSIFSFTAIFAQGLNQLHPPAALQSPGKSAVSGGLNAYDPLQDFYGQTGNMNFHVSPQFYGTSIAYITSDNGRFMYGLNINLLQVENAVEEVNGVFYRPAGQTVLLIPAWFTFKYRLDSYVDDTVLPYVIGGAGPSFGWSFSSSAGFPTNLGQSLGFWGGGAFAGIGLDYLWSDTWAFSADVRYQALQMDAPTGIDDSYQGFSLYLGLIRTFDW